MIAQAILTWVALVGVTVVVKLCCVHDRELRIVRGLIEEAVRAKLEAQSATNAIAKLEAYVRCGTFFDSARQAASHDQQLERATSTDVFRMMRGVQSRQRRLRDSLMPLARAASVRDHRSERT